MSDLSATTQEKDIAAKRWLSIIGIGEDGIDGLTLEAKRLIANAELVVGGARHLSLAGSLVIAEKLVWPSPIDGAFPAILARRGRPVAVLASGDPFNFGIGKQLAELVPAGEIRCLPQPSAFSLAAARMGWALQDTACISLHGRALEGIIPFLHDKRRILALAWDGSTAGHLKSLLMARGFGKSIITVLESMGGPAECRRAATARTLETDGIGALNTLAIEVVASSDARIVPFAPGLDDSMFESDGQLTKRDVRALTLASLAPRYGELLWDIGLGSGSIAIEWLLSDPSLRAIGIEEDPERAERAGRNALSLGVPRLEIVHGKSPAALAGLPQPDAIFIGGGISNPGVFETAWAALKPGGRLVANAVTLESEVRLAALHFEHGGELIRLALARSGAIGGQTGWRVAMPITHWRVRKP